MRQHLAECAQCRRNFASLKQVSGTLDVLGQMARYQEYPELSSSRMLAKIEERSVQRPSSAQPRSVRWVSLPVAILLVILPLAIMVALALRQFGVVTDLRKEIAAAAAPEAEANEVLFIPALRLGSINGFKTTVVAFTTDIPAFNGRWGEPYLLGPGSIHVAHTAEERIPKAQLGEAVGIYAELVERLGRR